MTLTTQLVLRALLADPGREMYGREIMQAASLATGTVYPILARLQAEGWISVREETIDKRAEGRPARRYYKLTESGIENVAAAMARASSQLSRLNLDGPTQPAPLNIGGIEIPIVIVSRDRDSASVSAFSLGAEVPEPEQDREPASEGPCEHRIPPGSFCVRCGRLIGGLRLSYGLSLAAKRPRPASRTPASHPERLERPPGERGRRRAVLGQFPGSPRPCRRRAGRVRA